MLLLSGERLFADARLRERLVQQFLAIDVATSGTILPPGVIGFPEVTPSLGSPFGGPDLVAPLRAQGLFYTPIFPAVECEGSTSAAYIHFEWGGGDFALYVYPTSDALRVEWPSGAAALSEIAITSCRPDSVGRSAAHINENLVLLLGPLQEGSDESVRATVVDAFLALTP